MRVLYKCASNVVVSVFDANSAYFSVRINDLCTPGGKNLSG